MSEKHAGFTHDSTEFKDSWLCDFVMDTVFLRRELVFGD